jgi:hypothetical protein
MTLTTRIEVSPVGNLQLEYKHLVDLYTSQPVMTRQFLDNQAQLIVQGLQDGRTRIHFLLPDQVLLEGQACNEPVPGRQRKQYAGGNILPGNQPLVEALLQKFNQLGHSLNSGVSTSSRLLRFSTAQFIVHKLLPDGFPVHYRLETGDEIPSQPVDGFHPTTGEPAQLPYATHALRFFLPQWVAFDEKGRLLTSNLQEAEAILHSMQTYLSLLGQAVSLDPTIVVDETYQRKRIGMLGQLVNQGRALGRHTTREIILGIQQRVSQDSLNRGLSLDIDYFDDQILSMATYRMKVIPFGRVMFLPSFVVLAARREAAVIARDPHLNSSTRRHLLALMAIFEQEFLTRKENKL